MSDLPLDETALQAAQEKASAEYADDAYDRKLISAYLREAGFEVEIRLGVKDTMGGSFPMPAAHTPRQQRQIGPWEEIPAVQAESEEE